MNITLDVQRKIPGEGEIEMKVDWSDNGIIVDAEDLAPLLELQPAEVPELMRKGLITSRFEQGANDDVGRLRVTFMTKEQQVRLTCDQDGTVLSTFRRSLIG